MKENLFVCRFISTCNFIEGTILKNLEEYSLVELKDKNKIKVKNNSFKENEKIVVAIKAENINISKEKNKITNQIEGKVVSSKYVSGNDITEVKLKTGEIFTSKKHAIQLQFEKDDNICISFSPDGKYFSSARESVKIFSTSNWQLFKEMSSNKVSSVSFSPDSKLFASGSFDSTITIYSTLDWHLVKKLNFQSGQVCQIVFSPCGKYLAAGISSKDIKVYSTSDWDIIKNLKYENYYSNSNKFSFSPDGNYFCLSADYYNTTKIYSTYWMSSM